VILTFVAVQNGWTCLRKQFNPCIEPQSFLYDAFRFVIFLKYRGLLLIFTFLHQVSYFIVQVLMTLVTLFNIQLSDCFFSIDKLMMYTLHIFADGVVINCVCFLLF
jgi:hypothetical protein